MLLFHLKQFSLQRLNRLGGVVEQVDSQLLARVNNLLESVVDLVLDDVLLVGQICDNDDVRMGRRSSGVGNSPQVLTLIAAALASRSGEIPKKASMTVQAAM